MSAMDRQQALASALMAALGADVALASLVGTRIYDAPPARAGMPSLTLRMVTGLDASTADTDAQLLTFDVDVWDRYGLGADLSRPRSIMGHIRRILHMQILTVPGVDVVTVLSTASQGPFRDPDEVALHGVVTLRVLCGHEAPLT